MWSPASGKPFTSGESRLGCSPTMGPSSPAKQRGEGRVASEVELGVLGVKFDHSRPYHPQTCGKVERFHQTQKKWLAAQPSAATRSGRCNTNSTSSPATTTPSGPTGR